MRGFDDIVLDTQIIEEKFDRKIAVCLDAAHFGGRENHGIRPLLPKKSAHGVLIGEIELRTIARRQVRKSFRFEAPKQCAADHAAMAGHKNFVRFVHAEMPFGLFSIFFFARLRNPHLRAENIAPRHP